MSENIFMKDCSECLGAGFRGDKSCDICEGTGYRVTLDGKFLIQQITPITAALKSIAASLHQIASRS